MGYVSFLECNYQQTIDQRPSKKMKISPNFTTSWSHLVACPTRKEAKDHVDGQVGHAVTAGLAGFHRPIPVKKPWAVKLISNWNGNDGSWNKDDSSWFFGSKSLQIIQQAHIYKENCRESISSYRKNMEKARCVSRLFICNLQYIIPPRPG